MNNNAAISTVTIGIVVALLVAGGGGGAFVYSEDVKSKDIKPTDISSISENADSIEKQQIDTESFFIRLCEWLQIEYTEKVKKCLDDLNVEVWGLNGITQDQILEDYREKCKKDGYKLGQTFSWSGCGFNASGFFARGMLHGRVIVAIEQEDTAQQDCDDPFPSYDTIVITSHSWLFTFAKCLKTFAFTTQNGKPPFLTNEILEI